MHTADSCRFGPLDVAFDAAVLRPRAWTLLQSEWACELSADLPPGPILELCAGVGHIGLVAATRTGRRLVQVEVDAHAAELAIRNAGAAGIASYEMRHRDMRDGIGSDECFPLILADPPYIPTRAVAEFPDDPTIAIDGGPDGGALARVCIAVAREHLIAQGALLLQTNGAAQAYALAEDVTAGLILREVRSVDTERAVALFTLD